MAGRPPAGPGLERQFRAALASLGAARRATPWPTAPGKGLELWLLFKIAEHLKSSGWTVSLCDGAGATLAATSPFLTRAQPGPIAPSAAGAAGFILVDKPAGLLPAEDFELHGGLQYRGRSGACHECDVTALPADIGRQIRSGGGGRPWGMPPVAVETKHHKGDGSLGEAREKLARVFDLTYVRLCHPRNSWQVFWTNVAGSIGWGSRYHWYKDRFRNGVYAIARSTSFQPGAERLLDHYKLKRFEYVTAPQGLQALLNSVDNQLT